MLASLRENPEFSGLGDSGAGLRVTAPPTARRGTCATPVTATPLVNAELTRISHGCKEAYRIEEVPSPCRCRGGWGRNRIEWATSSARAEIDGAASRPSAAWNAFVLGAIFSVAICPISTRHWSFFSARPCFCITLDWGSAAARFAVGRALPVA